MVKESARKCSHCGHNGHNSRTCNHIGHGDNNNNKGVCLKLFGVNIMERHDDSIKKSYSMGNLQAAGKADQNNNINVGADDAAGYLSDGLIHNKKRKAAHERKKGRPWTEEEHRVFLTGLKKLGKGDWRGIARDFVITRTPTQVASHAQKYFLRQATKDKRKRRTSLFDMHFKELAEQCALQDSSFTPKAKTTEASSSSSSSPGQTSKVLPQITTTTNSPQASSPSQVLNRFPHLCLDSLPAVAQMPAASCVPNYAPVIPYMAGMPGTVPYTLAVHYGSPTFHYMLNTQGGNFATCQPVIAHPSGIPSSPRSLPTSPSMGYHPTNSSITKKDALELKIGQPQPSQGANLSPSSSGAIRVT